MPSQTTNDKRRQREARDFRGGLSSPTEVSGPKQPFTFEQAVGAGVQVDLCGETYEVRPFPLRKLKAMSERYNKIPAVILAQALLPADEQSDPEKLANKINMLLNGDYLPDEVPVLIFHVQEQDDWQEPALDLVVETLTSSHEMADEDREALKNSLTVPDIVSVTRAMFSVNNGLRQRF